MSTLDFQFSASHSDRLSDALAACSGKFAIGVVQLRDFEGIAAHHGNNARELVTETLLRQISLLLRPEDHLLPLDEDRACIVLDNLLDPNHLQLAGLKLNRLFEEPVDIDGERSTFSVVAGFVYAGRALFKFDEIMDVLRRAEGACIEAYSDPNGFVVKSLDDSESGDNHWQITQMLTHAMEQHHVTLDYQPKMHLADGQIAGAEALVRWRNDGAIIPPDEFLPALSEQTMWDLTIYLYRRVLRDILDYELELPIAVNLDPTSLKQPSMLEFFQRESTLWGIEPERIIFEITETKALFDTERSKQVLEQIKNVGFKISIDDFGAGHSNMQRVRDLPIDEIKIDRSFAANIIDNPDNGFITKSIIDLANSLGLQTVAEGIEDADTLQLLNEWECELGQGFYLSKPLPINVFADL